MTQAVEWNFRAVFRNGKLTSAKLEFDSTDNAFNDNWILRHLLFSKEKEQSESEISPSGTLRFIENNRTEKKTVSAEFPLPIVFINKQSRNGLPIIAKLNLKITIQSRICRFTLPLHL